MSAGAGSIDENSSGERVATNLLDLPVPDFEEAQNFLRQLDPDTEDFTFQTFTDSDEKKSTYPISPVTGKIIDPLARVLHGSLQQHWQTLCSLSRQGAGVYVTINRTTLQGSRSKENITELRAYVADLDGAPLENHKRLKVEPHFIVQTSPGRFHVGYGIFDAPLDAANFKQTQQRLAQLMGGDPSICDLPRVIRVAGFPHQKDGSLRKLVRLISGSENPNYSEEYFQKELAIALAEQAKSAPAHRSLAEAAMAGLSALPERSRGIKEGERWGHGEKGVGRDNAMMAWAGHLFGKGLTEQEVLDDCLAWDAMFEPPLGEAVVRDKVSRLARKEAANAFPNGPSTSPHEPPSDGEFANLKWHGEGEQLVSPQWVIKNLLPKTGVALLSGQWGTGKTFVALDAAVSVMIGAQFATYRCKRPGGVLYIAAEGGSQIPIRLAAILEKKYPLHRGPLPFAWLDYCPAFAPGAGEVGLLQFVEEAARRMQEKHRVPLVLVIIDTLAAAARFKDENDAAEVQRAMGILNTVSRTTGALVLAVDHFGKAAETGTRGSSAKEASADAVIACLAERANSGTISNTRISVRKLRAGATGAETAFTLSVAPMGVDEDGDPVSTCVVAWSPVTIAAPPETARRDGWPKTTTARLWRACLLTALNQYGSQQMPFPDRPAVRAVSLEKVRVEFDVRSPLDRSLDRAKEMDKRRKAFRRGMEAVRAKEKIEIREINGVDWVWLTDRASNESQPQAPQGGDRPEQPFRESGHQGGHRTPP